MPNLNILMDGIGICKIYREMTFEKTETLGNRGIFVVRDRCVVTDLCDVRDRCVVTDLCDVRDSDIK